MKKMKPGDLVIYTPTFNGKNPFPKSWLGTILELDGNRAKIFWHELGEIQYFGIRPRQNWKIVSEA